MFVELVNFQASPSTTGSSNSTMRRSYLVGDLLSVVFLKQEALFLFRLIPFLGAKEAEPVSEIIPSLQRKIPPNLPVFYFPANQDPDETE